MNRLSRREFVLGTGATGLGLLAGCGRLPWQAEQPAKVLHVGYLTTYLSDAAARLTRAELFVEGLRQHGWVDGANIVIDWRFADERDERLHELARELVSTKVDVIVAEAPSAIRAAQQATATIPMFC